MASSSTSTFSFDAFTYEGYTVQADDVSGIGGWLAHRDGATNPTVKGSGPGNDWIHQEVRSALLRPEQVAEQLGLTPTQFDPPPRILVLYGSLRGPSAYSRFLAFEFARILEVLGCDVRVFDPHNLPPRDPAIEDHPKVQELRSLSLWSQGQVWVSPEMHGTMTGIFKNQIDWLPLNTGSVRPTQGRSVCVAQVNGGSQSFNVVNALRLLARWMRMPCSTNQSSVPKAWQEFDGDGRMKDSPLRDRVVDVAEEFHKFLLLNRPHAEFLTDRYSERKEAAKEGRLLTQAEKEARLAADKAQVS